jgi:hypothetical protein
MLHENMATPLTLDYETVSLKHCDYFLPLKSWKSRHTETLCTPTERLRGRFVLSASRQSSMASRTRSINSSRDFACV